MTSTRTRQSASRCRTSGSPVSPALTGERDQAVEFGPEQQRIGSRFLAPLVAEQAHGHPPACAYLPDDVVSGGVRPGEEDLAEIAFTGHLPDAPHLDTGLIHRYQEERDPGVAARSRRGAGKDETPLGVEGVEVQIFCPLTTHSSPSRAALVRSAARSEPASGSEYP